MYKSSNHNHEHWMRLSRNDLVRDMLIHREAWMCTLCAVSAAFAQAETIGDTLLQDVSPRTC